MGCDIHLYKEKKINGEWVTADVWEDSKYEEGHRDVPYESRFTDRNYKLFGVLAGVREEYPFSLKERGLPFNACPEVKKSALEWDSDGHSHSYLSISELKDLRDFLKKEKIKVEGMKSSEELAALKATLETESPDYSLVYPYSRWTNAKGHEEFSVDLPASFIVGDSLDKIISSLDEIKAEDSRIVFWFDN